MNEEEQQSFISEVTHMEVELNSHLTKAYHLIENLRSKRQTVTHEGMKRRGWGCCEELETFYKIADTVIYDIKSHITEFGGGTTRQQDQRLKTLSELYKYTYDE